MEGRWLAVPDPPPPTWRVPMSPVMTMAEPPFDPAAPFELRFAEYRRMQVYGGRFDRAPCYVVDFDSGAPRGWPRSPDRRLTPTVTLVMRGRGALHSVRDGGWWAPLRMEKHLGQLGRDEEVDHLDEDKHHNAISNLRLMSKADHASRHYGDRYA
jgi:hypothetical protein